MRNDKIKSGTKTSPLGLIPDDWDIKELGQIFEFKNGINAGKESYGSGIKFINVMEIIYNASITPDIVKGSVQISDDQKKLYLVKDGDVMFNRTSETTDEIGLTAVYYGTDEIVFGGFVIRGRPIDNSINNDYKRYCFRSKLVRDQIIRSGQGAVRSNIGQGDLEKVKIALPPFKEQKAIANLLSAWDKAISNQQILITQKQKRKKWLMQQLLTGKKKLKGFHSEWKEVSINSIFERVTRKNNEVNTTVVTISAQRGFVMQNDYFNKVVASAVLNNYFLVEKGEFCYNKSYSNGYPWGATKRLNNFEKAVVTTLYICFGIRDVKKTSGGFFEQFFEAGLLEQGLALIAHEGGRAHGLLNVTPSDFFTLKIKVPAYDEQAAIGSVLQTSDKEIQILKDKLDKLKKQRKGLMQQLLTGKMRLKRD